MRSASSASSSRALFRIFFSRAFFWRAFSPPTAARDWPRYVTRATSPPKFADAGAPCRPQRRRQRVLYRPVPDRALIQMTRSAPWRRSLFARHVTRLGADAGALAVRPTAGLGGPSASSSASASAAARPLSACTAILGGAPYRPAGRFELGGQDCACRSRAECPELWAVRRLTADGVVPPSPRLACGKSLRRRLASGSSFRTELVAGEERHKRTE